MDKQLLLDICDRIATLQELKFVDIDFGQLTGSQRPAVAFPCCLVDTSYNNCLDIAGLNQQVSASVVIRVAFQAMAGSTHSKSAFRNDALKSYDILKLIHQKLQSWDNNGSFDPLTRATAVTEKRGDDIRVFKITYTTSFIDEFE